MVKQTPQEEQLRIELQAMKYAGVPFDPRLTVAEVFGDMEDWTYRLGPYELMLNPINGEWLFWDNVHNSVEGTGWQAGEGVFQLVGDDDVTMHRGGRWATERERLDLSQDQRQFASLQDRYRELRKQHSALEFSTNEFVAAVYELRFQAKDGAWWQVRPDDGAWLLWDGAAWIEAVQPMEWL